MRWTLNLILALIRSGHIQFTPGGFRLTSGSPRNNSNDKGPWGADPSPVIHHHPVGRIAIAVTVLLTVGLVGFFIWASIAMYS